ncbi:hypothetical protein E2C01_026859 [Portunus trituberculatus]|uniref:Uncharacterized protein n=1 Tax=Portunus trituberculatus TaxID=210409 RepID=A0A5B7EJT2_PORTR|nr:hypothetical protein [Portunus trituberculatus]
MATRGQETVQFWEAPWLGKREKKEHIQPRRQAAKVRESTESTSTSPLARRLEGPLEELPADEFPPLIRLRGAGKVLATTSIPQVETPPFTLLLRAL